MALVPEGVLKRWGSTSEPLVTGPLDILAIEPLKPTYLQRLIQGSLVFLTWRFTPKCPPVGPLLTIARPSAPSATGCWTRLNMVFLLTPTFRLQSFFEVTPCQAPFPVQTTSLFGRCLSRCQVARCHGVDLQSGMLAG